LQIPVAQQQSLCNVRGAYVSALIGIGIQGHSSQQYSITNRHARMLHSL
jgi:hypothetical protein